MTSWYSNILTKTTTQISNLRTTLLSSEADGDTEDDTHVCRVLRNYYTEKGRPFPPWLPVDPKAAAAPQPIYAQPGPNRAGYGMTGGQQGQHQQSHTAGGGGGLSSLWDNNGGGGGGAANQPQSLRAGAGRLGGAQRMGGQQAPGPYSSASQQGPGGGVASSAQDRLKQRLWGGAGSRNSSPSQGNQEPFRPPGSSGGGGGGGIGGQDSATGGRPYVGANAPWASGGDEYGGSGAPVSNPGGNRRQGLPSGPRGYR